jgi:putative oxidoreductase
VGGRRRRDPRFAVQARDQVRGGHDARVPELLRTAVPAPLAALAIVTELLAPIALVIGLGGRVAALGIIGLMLGAMSTHLSAGFFMNWSGTLAAGVEGFEYHLLAIALAAVVTIRGSGAWSADRRLHAALPHPAAARGVTPRLEESFR